MYKNRRYNAQTKDESEANEMKRTAAFADGSEGIVASVLESEELKYGDFSSLEAALNVAKTNAILVSVSLDTRVCQKISWTNGKINYCLYGTDGTDRNEVISAYKALKK